jgi:hypothetical protein
LRGEPDRLALAIVLHKLMSQSSNRPTAIIASVGHIAYMVRFDQTGRCHTT